MKISIVDDNRDTRRMLECFAKPAGHGVEIWNDRVQDDAICTPRVGYTTRDEYEIQACDTFSAAWTDLAVNAGSVAMRTRYSSMPIVFTCFCAV